MKTGYMMNNILYVGMVLAASISVFQTDGRGPNPLTHSNSSTHLGAILGKCEIESKSQEYTAILMEQLPH